MSISGTQCRAARALVQWAGRRVARLAKIDESALIDFEAGRGDPGTEAILRIRHALEEGGAVFIPEDKYGGSGVRLKFNAKDVRAINKWEDEGGPVGDDDV